MSDEQEHRLLALLTESRANYNWSTDLSRRIFSPPDPAARRRTENIAVFEKEEEAFGRKFLAQAQRILTPMQLAAYDQFQTKQRVAILRLKKMTA